MNVSQWPAFCWPPATSRWIYRHRDWKQYDWNQMLFTGESQFSLECFRMGERGTKHSFVKRHNTGEVVWCVLVGIWKYVEVTFTVSDTIVSLHKSVNNFVINFHRERVMNKNLRDWNQTICIFIASINKLRPWFPL